MLFQHTWQKVLSGEKTQTRRIVKPDDWWGDDWVHRGRRTLYKVGRTYAVQPARTAKSIASILITDIRHEDVREISPEDVKAEGFDSLLDFMETWCQMHDKQGYLFGCIDAKAKQRPDASFFDYIVKRPTERYAAWVLTFRKVENA